MIRRHAHRDHVFFDVLAEVDACVESGGNDIHATVIRGDVEHDFRIFAREIAKLWCEYRTGGNRGTNSRTRPAGFLRSPATRSKAT
jgi:hypothetical protein